MMNWSRSLGGGSVRTTIFEERIGYTGDERPLPVLMGESTDTMIAVKQLPQRVQEVLTVFWAYNAHTIDWMLRATPRMRMWAMGPQRFREHLDNGHAVLMRALR
jgi:hypothetical protein